MKKIPYMAVHFLAVILALAAPAVRAEEPAQDDKIVIGANDILSDNDMDMKRGAGGSTSTTSISVVSDQTMNSTTSGNTLNVGGSLTNGSITTGNNFGGSGFGSYVMNTGNNSTINSGVSLSVLMLNK